MFRFLTETQTCRRMAVLNSAMAQVDFAKNAGCECDVCRPKPNESQDVTGAVKEWLGACALLENGCTLKELEEHCRHNINWLEISRGGGGDREARNLAQVLVFLCLRHGLLRSQNHSLGTSTAKDGTRVSKTDTTKVFRSDVDKLGTALKIRCHVDTWHDYNAGFGPLPQAQCTKKDWDVRRITSKREKLVKGVSQVQYKVLWASKYDEEEARLRHSHATPALAHASPRSSSMAGKSPIAKSHVSPQCFHGGLACVCLT